MKQENNQNTRVGKYSDLREEIETGKVSKSVSKSPRETTRIKKSETRSETITIPIDNNSAMETRTIDIEQESDAYQNPELFKKYKNRKILFTILYCLGGAVVLALLIIVLVSVLGK